MSYSYVNGCYSVTTPIYDDFKRFHSMNAQHRHFIINEDTTSYATVRYDVWQFISYATPIMQVVYDRWCDSYIISCNDNPFGYSPSTSRQISRWLRENNFNLDSAMLRFTYENCNSVTPQLATYHYGNVTIDFHDSRTFHNIWR